MSIGSETSRIKHIGNGLAATFSFPFKIPAASHIRVLKYNPLTDTVTVLALNTNYSITGVGSSSGGSITLVAGALAEDLELYILLFPPLLQETSIKNQKTFHASIHEDVFDNLLRISQRLYDGLKRSLKLGEVQDPTTISTELPAPVSKGVLRWNEAMDGFEAKANAALGLIGSDVGITPVGNLTSVNAQLAVVELQQDIDTRTLETDFQTHVTNVANPHLVIHAQLPDGGAIPHAGIDIHIASNLNPHGVTAAQVGKDVAQWNAGKISGIDVDGSGIGDGKILKFNAGTGVLEYAQDVGDVAGGIGNDVLGKTASNLSSEWKTILGTADEVVVTHGVGQIVMSLAVAPIKRFKSDLAFNGTDTTKTVDVSATITAASEAIWQLKDNATDFEVLGVKITSPTATSVYIESNPPLVAGNYKLVGIQ